MPQVIFSHTKRQEKKYLTQLFAEKKWFEQENFPAFIPSSINDIEQEITKRNESIKIKTRLAEKHWQKIEREYFQIVGTFQNGKIQRRYLCHTSNFGPQGKYSPPNRLTIRLRKKRDEKYALETVGHELLHLVLADLFDSKKLNYAEREGMVDALILETDLVKLFPDYEKQTIGKLNQALFKSITRS